MVEPDFSPIDANDIASYKQSFEDMCADTWRWQESNPQGYGE